jgi:hypothetical protein
MQLAVLAITSSTSYTANVFASSFIAIACKPACSLLTGNAPLTHFCICICLQLAGLVLKELQHAASRLPASFWLRVPTNNAPAC